MYRKSHIKKMRLKAMQNLTDRLLEVFTELTYLTRIKRTGWILAGVPDPETIADHCYETAIFAYILSKHVDVEVDMGKVLTMALFHEIGEVRIGDFPRRAKKYVKKFKKDAESTAIKDIIEDVAGDLIPTLHEFEKCETVEARLVEAAEELQIIFKALIYAKENKGDISEYRNDVNKYDSQGFEIAKKVADVIKVKLNKYLGDKEYWEIGYRESE
jgi:putative hydrolase of HD superfamily